MKGAKMGKLYDNCQACLVPWSRHPGIQPTCEALQAARKKRWTMDEKAQLRAAFATLHSECNMAPPSDALKIGDAIGVIESITGVKQL